jgi:hypothetical protein
MVADPDEPRHCLLYGSDGSPPSRDGAGATGVGNAEDRPGGHRPRAGDRWIGAPERPRAPGLASVLGASHVRYVVLRARATEVDPGGRWSMTGEIEIGDATVPISVTVTHHGVYRFGDDAKAWLTVRADISHGVRGRRQRHGVALVADVLAIRPRPAPSVVLAVSGPQRGLPASPRV